MCTDIENSMTDYDVEIDAELYNHDFDEIDIQSEQEETIQTDILFE